MQAKQFLQVSDDVNLRIRESEDNGVETPQILLNIREALDYTAFALAKDPLFVKSVQRLLGCSELAAKRNVETFYRSALLLDEIRAEMSEKPKAEEPVDEGPTGENPVDEGPTGDPKADVDHREDEGPTGDPKADVDHREDGGDEK